MSSVGNSGPHSHVPQNGCHHARGKFLRSGVTAAAVGAKTLLCPGERMLSALAVLRGTQRCWSRFFPCPTERPGEKGRIRSRAQAC